MITPEGRSEVLGHLLPMFTALGELDRSLSDEEREVVARYPTGAIAAIRQVL